MHKLLGRLGAATLFAAAMMVLPAMASADTVTSNFENPPYSIGTINGQDGWSATGSAGSGCAIYDEGVASSLGTSGFGSQSFRISNAVTSGCFGDQAFSKSLANEAGETAAINSGMSGGTRQSHFEAQFDLASASSTQQTGLVISVSPDRGDGARMSYLRFEDQADGIHVFFDDYTTDFNETDIATISRTAPHTIKFVMDFVDGAANDIVKIYIDGNLEITGTSWEKYFADNQPAIAPPTVDSMLFRAGGTAAPGTAGAGFLIDNLSLVSGPSAPATITVTIDKFIDGAMATSGSATGAAFPMTATWNAANIGAGSGNYDLDADGFNGDPTPYQAITSMMTSGASYTTSEVTGGSVVGASCADGKPFALNGYSSGDSLSEAQSAATSSVAPALTNITSNKFIIVWNKTCAAVPPAATSSHVTIVKYVDGAHATAGNANSATFPMQATYSFSNDQFPGGIAGTDPYDIGSTGNNTPNAYEAQTLQFYPGASYGTFEHTNTPVVGASCADGKPFALNGYSSGDSLGAAQAAATSTTAPAFTNITSDKYVIVWNVTCAPPTPPVPPANACATPGTAPAGYTLQKGTSGNDTVTLAPNTMYVGKGGNDTVTGGDGNYIVCMGNGNDTITLGNGNSTVDAGNGNNTVTVGNGEGTIKAGNGNDTVVAGNGARTITVGNGNNKVTSGDGAQTITSGSGNDEIRAGAGADTVNAGGGNNKVWGEDGDDMLTTASGNDTLDGGAGSDTCQAGAGNNTKTSCEL